VLSVIAGPHAGREFAFDGRDSFLVGRSKDAHFQLPAGDPYFSRRHLVIELNPPRCRLLDLKSRNGVLVNGRKVAACELQHGDEVQAGDTTFRVSVSAPDPDTTRTLELPASGTDITVEYQSPAPARLPCPVTAWWSSLAVAAWAWCTARRGWPTAPRPR
jgi:pSer/pThr/pTyr-binding forkhead associated (FHA) protein